MTRVKVIVPNHDCKKPEMTIPVTMQQENGFWRKVFGLEPVTFIQRVPKAYEAEWICECEAVWLWEWMPFANNGGYWRCTSRPERKTEWVDL